MLIKIPFNKPSVAVGPLKPCSGLKKEAVRGLPGFDPGWWRSFPKLTLALSQVMKSGVHMFVITSGTSVALLHRNAVTPATGEPIGSGNPQQLRSWCIGSVQIQLWPLTGRKQYSRIGFLGFLLMFMTCGYYSLPSINLELLLTWTLSEVIGDFMASEESLAQSPWRTLHHRSRYFKCSGVIFPPIK